MAEIGCGLEQKTAPGNLSKHHGDTSTTCHPYKLISSDLPNYIQEKRSFVVLPGTMPAQDGFFGRFTLSVPTQWRNFSGNSSSQAEKI